MNTQRKRIGIDCRELRDPARESATGIGRYVFELVSGLLAQVSSDVEYVLFVSHNQTVPEAFEHAEIRVLPASASRFFVGPHWLTARAFLAANLDLLHAPANVVPLGYNGTTVVTVHDLIIYEHPEWFPGGQWLSTNIVVPRSLRRASRILVPSQAVADTVIRLFDIPQARIEVVSHGVDAVPSVEEVDSAWTALCERIPRRVLESPYALFVGTLEPRKNIGRLVEAFKEVVQSVPDAQLLLAGGRGWGIPDEFFDQLPDAVHELGYISEAEKTALLRHANVFVYPSLAEGFGLPILEAHREGTRVLTSDRAPMNTLVRKGDVLVDPESISDLSKALSDLLITKDVQGRGMGEQLPTWDEAARTVRMSYDMILQ